MEELEQEELDKDLLGVGTSTHELPEVPTADIKEPAKEKEKKKGIVVKSNDKTKCRTIPNSSSLFQSQILSSIFSTS